MKKWATLMGGALTLALCGFGKATVLRVPSEYSTIQAGIDAALEGDTVLVADGTYTGDGNRDLDFGGVNMVVMSENGPGLTRIDCQGSVQYPHRAFHFHSGEDPSSVVKGFTIVNGCAHGSWPQSNGGGISCDVGSPTIEGNMIVQNTAGAGGGISCLSSSAIITGNTISGNSGCGIACFLSSPIIDGNLIAENMGGGGGGIRCENHSSPTIEGNTISRNEAGKGGGIGCWDDCSPTIADNHIAANTTSSGGGAGIYLRDHSSPGIRGNMITGNTAIEDESVGGGISSWLGSSPTIEGNTIIGNRAGMGGGVGFVEAGTPLLEGNTVAANTASLAGGGICCTASSPVLEGNTITGNAASWYGGGVSCEETSSATLLNSIVWSDSAGTGNEMYVDGSSSITATYCNVEGGWPGEGNIDEDPMFVLAEKTDYRLLWGSPCIDAGHPDSLDPDGTRSDMGAHLFDQNDYLTLYLTPDTTEVLRGGVLGVTYTAMNRWAQPEAFWVLTEATLPNGNPMTIMGPDQYTLPADFTVQRHLDHAVPGAAPLGVYVYGSRIGVPPSTLYDEDSFRFRIVEPQ